MMKTPLENWIIERTGIKEPTRKALEAYQQDCLLNTIKYAKENSRFYKTILADKRYDELCSLENIQELPFTYPMDIRTQPLDFLCGSLSRVSRIVTLNTTGTSGEEKRIFFTQEDLLTTVDFFDYGMRCLTQEGDRILVMLPGSAPASIGDLLNRALTQANKVCIVHGLLTNPDDVEKSVRDNDINCIVGIPLQVLYLSRRKPGIFEKVKKVLVSTDYVPDVLVKELKELYDCLVFNHYGMTEMGYGGGVECEALCGYHLREADLYVEIVDPKSGKPVADGDYGEVVFTTLNRKAMPLIRYRTGDIAAFATEPCRCGSFLKTMKKVRGRIENSVVLEDNNAIYLSEIDEIVLQFRDVMDYKAFCRKDNVLLLTVAVNRHEKFTKRNKMKQLLEDYLIHKQGFHINIDIVVIEDDLSPKISNSMIKRKIYHE